jgi:radical SAM protein (TIGR01212 family)
MPTSENTGNPRAGRSPFYSLAAFFRVKFGCRVHKISLDGGFTCPNRDGTVGSGGCVFCDPESFSPSRRQPRAPIDHQIDEGIRRLKRRQAADHFVAYFQPATNTHAPTWRLRELYQQALSHPAIVGLVVGTRPDCVADDVLDLLAELSRTTWVSIEYGLQSIHDRTLKLLNRGHDYRAFEDAVQRSHERSLAVGAHVILGLPGESTEDIRATADELARLQLDSVKLHNLYVAKGTPLAAWLAAGKVCLPRLDQYVNWAADFIERLPAGCVIDRLSAGVPRQYLVGPDWCLDKSAIRRAIEAELSRRGTRQGTRHQR